METLVCPHDCIGKTVEVIPEEGDLFSHNFIGRIIGVRNQLFQVRDQDDDVWEVHFSQLIFID